MAIAAATSQRLQNPGAPKPGFRKNDADEISGKIEDQGRPNQLEARNFLVTDLRAVTPCGPSRLMTWP
jgi:hypothetical protein